jgi:aerotaxis receptor
MTAPVKWLGQPNSNPHWHLLHLGNQSVQSSESARQESEQLGSNVDQAQLLTSHFLQMLCDKLLNKGAQASTRQFPEPAQ